MVLLFLLKIKIACIIKCLWHRLKIMQNRRKGNMGAEIKKWQSRECQKFSNISWISSSDNILHWCSRMAYTRRHMERTGGRCVVTMQVRG